MGAWGIRNFENDQALDFVADFTDTPTVESLEESLETVLALGAEGEYIEVDEASAALAAAEIVAALLAKPAPDFPTDLHAVLASLPGSTTLQKLAQKAVKQVVKKSELQELWAEGDDLPDWEAIQTDLVERLK